MQSLIWLVVGMVLTLNSDGSECFVKEFDRFRLSKEWLKVAWLEDMAGSAVNAGEGNSLTGTVSIKPPRVRCKHGDNRDGFGVVFGVAFRVCGKQHGVVGWAWVTICLSGAVPTAD